MAVRSAFVNVMEGAALKAARALVRDFGEVEQLQASRKGPADFVANAESRAGRTLGHELGRARPGYGMLMAGSASREGADPRHRWIVAPLDGGLNFCHGLPHFAISVALQSDGDIVACLIHDPIRHETYWAERGIGAFANDRRLRVSGRRRLDESVIAAGIPLRAQADHPTYGAQLAILVPRVAGIRRFGAASLDLAYVAAGRYDGYWEHGLSPWSIAAGILLVREAGGFVSEIGGGHDMLRSGSVLAANDHLHLELGRLLRGAGPAPAAATESPHPGGRAGERAGADST